METLAEIRGLTKAYGKTLGVNNMSLVIPRGKIIGFWDLTGAVRLLLLR